MEYADPTRQAVEWREAVVLENAREAESVEQAKPSGRCLGRSKHPAGE
jgi:hypothetical protein